jgi:hypothetical protein
MDADIDAARINEDADAILEEGDRGVVAQIDGLAVRQAIRPHGEVADRFLEPPLDVLGTLCLFDEEFLDAIEAIDQPLPAGKGVEEVAGLIAHEAGITVSDRWF